MPVQWPVHWQWLSLSSVSGSQPHFAFSHIYTHPETDIGIQIFMVTYSMVVFSETPRPARKGRHRYMVINLLLFLISTLATILVFTRYFTLWWDADGPLDYAQRRHGQAVWATLFNNIAGNFTICLGDALLLYRCYIVWADRKWVMIVPTVTYIAALGTSSHHLG